MNERFGRISRLLSVLAFLTLANAASPQTQTEERAETRYLAFQVFTGSPDPTIPIGDSGLLPLGPIPSQDQLSAFVQDVVHSVGSVGDKHTHLAIIFGPLSFDHSDTEIRRLIASAFAVALKQNVAIGFHLDDSMFWARRSDLLRSPDNVEWPDWNGTPSTGRRIEWGPQPKKIPPQLCFNSRAIQAEVRRRATEVIGKAIKAGVDELKRQGKEDLFAGVIAGWETQIGQDFDTGRYLGYHALTNRGFSKNHPPPDMDKEREKIVQEFITVWCKGLADAESQPTKYTRTPLFCRAGYSRASLPTRFLTRNTTISRRLPSPLNRRIVPASSTYPQPGLFEQIYAETAQHGQTGWASSEGTNLQLGSGPGQSGMNMETYLAKMFNHGATLVNIFSWGVGGEANRKMDFRVVTEGEEALNAYRKFLRGERLVETVSTSSSYLERLPAKIHRIQQELPAWIQKTGKQAQAEPLMRKLDAALKVKDFKEAEQTADSLLKLLVSP